ncbi:spermine/spermidine synthase domain-containing protein [Saccharolobus islandicus]|uniref:Polyamine aminopropyltransferase n=1 Tax=Saccharolobus islandicus (strain L.D.8.5 / Lassen \|nr:spermidine synthase [Sulfolobus islandicus]ADB87256.1 Spermine synthase [Sulfolobus islandicus L.D.8.5]
MFGWHWLLEWQTPYEFHGHLIEKVFAEEKTQYQHVTLVEFTRFGKGLIIDGKVQSTLYDEHIYHELLVHPLLLSLPKPPKNVLILGGGEGATLREVLKYKSVEKAVMVDIDEKVIEFAKKYLYEWHQGAFEDKRTSLVITDGLKFINETKDKYDAIILDLTDPIKDSTSYMLYTKEFYEKLRGILNQGGGIVTQATSPSFSLEVYVTIYNTIKEVFKEASASYTYMASFDGLWGFVYGGVRPDLLSEDEVNSRIRERISGQLRFYDDYSHKISFSLPKNIKSEFKKITKVSTEKDPIYVPA